MSHALSYQACFKVWINSLSDRARLSLCSYAYSCTDCSPYNEQILQIIWGQKVVSYLGKSRETFIAKAHPFAHNNYCSKNDTAHTQGNSYLTLDR